jgi:hypothetical protein
MAPATSAEGQEDLRLTVPYHTPYERNYKLGTSRMQMRRFLHEEPNMQYNTHILDGLSYRVRHVLHKILEQFFEMYYASKFLISFCTGHGPAITFGSIKTNTSSIDANVLLYTGIKN